VQTVNAFAIIADFSHFWSNFLVSNSVHGMKDSF
jgi:hypothetical protein